MCTGAYVDSALGRVGYYVSDIMILIHLNIKSFNTILNDTLY